jgi:hypothetical protein
VRVIDRKRIVDAELLIREHIAQNHDVELQRAVSSPAFDRLTVRVATVIEMAQMVFALSAVDECAVGQTEQVGQLAVSVRALHFGRRPVRFTRGLWPGPTAVPVSLSVRRMQGLNDQTHTERGTNSGTLLVCGMRGHL